MKAFLASLAVLVAIPAVAHAERIKVAVVPGIAVNLDAARVDALSQDLADALATELDVDAVGGLAVRRQLPPEGVPADCVATPTCTAEVAQRLGATQLLFVVMVDTGSNGAVQIDSTWVEPATGKRASRPAIDIAVLAEAKARFQSAARQLLPDAPVRAQPVAGGIDRTMTPGVPRHFTRTAMITAGVAAVGLGVGIGFGLHTKSRYDDCDQPAAPCTRDDEDSIRTSALIADLGFVTAIAGAVATAVLFTTSAEEPRLVVSPGVERSGGVSLTATGRF